MNGRRKVSNENKHKKEGVACYRPPLAIRRYSSVMLFLFFPLDA